MNKLRLAAFAALKKWKSRSGESITEVLIALLISAVALVMLASMINSASHLVARSEKRLEEYYGKNASLVGHTGSAVGTVKLEGDSVEFASYQVTYAQNGDDGLTAYWLAQNGGSAGG